MSSPSLPAWALQLPPGVLLVGGSARDQVRGERPKDWDLVAIGEVAAQAAQAGLAAAFGRPPVLLGKRFPEICWRFMVDGAQVDLVAAENLDADLRRRDFTINAMAIDPRRGEITDPLHGREDIARGIIRMTAPQAFTEDPVRLLRAHRFAAQFGFVLEESTRAEIKTQAARLKAAAPERLTAEMDALLNTPRAAAQLTQMRGDGTLFAALPELIPIDGLTQNHYHHTDVLSHVLEAVAVADDLPALSARIGPDFPALSDDDYLLLKWAVLLHDLGKAATRTEDALGNVHFYGHELVSERLTRETGERLRFSGERTLRLARLARFHLRLLFLHKNPPGPPAFRRLVRDLGADLPLLIALAIADKSATRGNAAAGTVDAIAALGRRAMQVHADEHDHLSNLPKLVDGLRACEIMQIRPGRDLGRALDALMDAQVAGSVSTSEGAEAFLSEWAAAQRAAGSL